MIYELDPYEYVLGSNNELNYKKNLDNNGFCSVGFSIFDVGDLNVWIAGDVFLTKYMAIFDRD